MSQLNDLIEEPLELGAPLDHSLTQRSEDEADDDDLQPRRPKRHAKETADSASAKRRKVLHSCGQEKGDEWVPDIVHKYVKLNPLCRRIVDTPEFQRLRDIHQLGACRWIYKDATHSRFSHCLGVMHLAEMLIRQLKRIQHRLLRAITEEDILCVMVAGLCHDLGHGPFSHAFDGVFLPLVGASKDWSHEEMSCRMLDYLLKANRINLDDHFGNGEGHHALKRIEDCIMGRKPHERLSHGEHGWTGPREFLYNIVNNARCGFDVDKCDYLIRDPKMGPLEIASGWDLPGMFREARVFKAEAVPGYDDPETEPYQICFPRSSVHKVMQFFRTRHQLHKTMYQHSTVKAVELMIGDILASVNDHLLIRAGTDEEGNPIKVKMSDSIHHFGAFSRMRESLLDVIRLSDGSEYEEGNQLLERIDRRQLYRCLGLAALPAAYRCLSGGLRAAAERIKAEILGRIKASSGSDIVNRAMDEYVRLDSKVEPPSEKDVIVDVLKIHYGRGQDNPVRAMRFYDHRHKRLGHRADTTVVAREIPEAEYETSLPRAFQELKVWVFVKHVEVAPAVAKAYAAWARDAMVGDTLEVNQVEDEDDESPPFLVSPFAREDGDGEAEDDSGGESMTMTMTVGSMQKVMIRRTMTDLMRE